MKIGYRCPRCRSVTYAEPGPTGVACKWGRCNGTVREETRVGTVTGRMSCKDAPLQNIPRGPYNGPRFDTTKRLCQKESSPRTSDGIAPGEYDLIIWSMCTNARGHDGPCSWDLAKEK
jgi:hypothetical protein